MNAWVQVAKLFKSLDPTIRIQQTLAPASAEGPTWKAVEPLVDAWTLQNGEISGFAPEAPGIELRVATALVSDVTLSPVEICTMLTSIYNNSYHECAGVDRRCPQRWEAGLRL